MSSSSFFCSEETCHWKSPLAGAVFISTGMANKTRFFFSLQLTCSSLPLTKTAAVFVTSFDSNFGEADAAEGGVALEMEGGAVPTIAVVTLGLALPGEICCGCLSVPKEPPATATPPRPPSVSLPFPLPPLERWQWESANSSHISIMSIPPLTGFDQPLLNRFSWTGLLFNLINYKCRLIHSQVDRTHLIFMYAFLQF